MTKKKLTAKQDMFCREYLTDLNATQAAIRAGYSENQNPPKTGYYTYALVCPLQNDVFYIGKGKGNRVFNHAKSKTNDTKVERIRAIHAHNLPIKHLILSEHKSEVEAYRVEADLIEAIGYDRLTNISLIEARNRKIKNVQMFLPLIVSFSSVKDWATKCLEIINPYRNKGLITFLGHDMDQNHEDIIIEMLESAIERG